MMTDIDYSHADLASDVADANIIITGTVHPFERAGMGKAPFRLCSEGEKERQRRLGGGFAFCDACGTQISRVFYVKSSCGKVSMAGCDCIEKLANFEPELTKKVQAIVRDQNRKRAAINKIKKTEAVKETLELLNDPEVKATLGRLPHPKGWSDQTLFTWCCWMANNAGAKGKAEVAEVIQFNMAK